MADCYITRTGSFLPGKAIDNEGIGRYLGKMLGEAKVRQKILKANGIKSRHYALDEQQNITHSTYELAAKAVEDCLSQSAGVKADYLSAGSTHTPLLAPGLASLLHDELSQKKLIDYTIEINSNSGICSSGAQAFVNASRAIRSGDVKAGICVGVEQPSVALRSKAFRPTYDLFRIFKDLRSSQWFMATFLRFMLSDGAGAWLLEPHPTQAHSLKVDWCYSRSFANEAPLCMQLPSQAPLVLRQDVNILSQYIGPLSERMVEEALEVRGKSR
ncbi:MAG: beta-ketoacyl synthase N-terminal-like domain-containing protein [Deinococcales bacterium]